MQRITYIHQRSDWPRFRWDNNVIAAPLAAVRHHQGRLLGRMEALGFDLRIDAMLKTLTQDAVKTSEIEGDVLDREQVRASVARRLGLHAEPAVSQDRRADAIATVIVDATQNFALPLTAQRLFSWHAALFAEGGGWQNPIQVGMWRSGRVTVESGRPGREIVHFEGPAASLVPEEMNQFLAWFEDKADATDLVLKAAVAHLWFVTIHPFDDGNGRIGRAIADMMLARSEATGQRFYSMSARLRIERSAYYETLEATQKGDLDITRRLSWFLSVLDRALSDADEALASTIRKGRFWERLSGHSINTRQHAMLNRLLDGFEGKLTSSKWAQITKCSQDTALRDIGDLMDRQLLLQDAPGGRSTSYSLAE